MPTHLAAIAHEKHTPFTILPRQTPKPGRGELLIAVKSIALNPADIIMRNTGLFIPPSAYPTVLGFDLAGVVIAVGEDVPSAPVNCSKGPASGVFFEPGRTRVAAYAASAWKSCEPDYGAFQEMCLVPWQHVVPLPDDRISWNEAATLPVSVQVPLSAWDALGILRVGENTISSRVSASHSAGIAREEKGEALLIWGASSSVGTMGVQSARVLRDPNSNIGAVYAVAGLANHAYVSGLGADRVFDYKDPHVVDAVVSAAKEDSLVIRHCFLATGELGLCQAVLKLVLVDSSLEEKRSTTAKIASAPPIPADAEQIPGVETIFVMPSMTDEVERLAQFEYWLGTWLRERLSEGNITPSPRVRVVGKGLEAINKGLDELARGVSCVKLVVEVAE
ncbi:GroES-like protein [Aspergillus pseudodeflectus]|uniref:GroES-like protein n=1 Tax=Aspergillus pseudodeflectus TaxID=176178 RepID=A0ABR4JJ77_9EURO